MRKGMPLFFTIVILFFLISPIRAEILNFCSFRDEFIDLSRRVAHQGIIYVVLNDGKPAIEASFQTKLPPKIVIDLYRNYLESKGIKDPKDKISEFSEAKPVWRWSGDVGKEEKTLFISYLPKRAVTTIKLISCRKDPNFAKHYPSLIKLYPELCLKKGKIILSREVFQGNNFSGLFLYSVVGSSGRGLETIRSKFIGAGWKERTKKQSSNSNGLCMFFKNNLIATIVATRENGGTSLLITLKNKVNIRNQ